MAIRSIRDVAPVSRGVCLARVLLNIDNVFTPLHRMSDLLTIVQPALLKGKVACITGGLTGIGRAIAVGFLGHGASVAINYLGGAGDDALLKKLLLDVEPHQENLIAIAGDVSEPETGTALVKAAVDKWGRLDVFVSNAGICTFAQFLESIALANVRTAAPKTDSACSAGLSQTSTPRPSARTSMARFTAPKPPRARWRLNRLLVAPS